jgi:TRAP-type mannitol/chloroaromatic compound transport system permease small subunit
MRRVVNAIEAVSGLVGLIGAWIMAPLILSMVYEVVARHALGAPTSWAYELGYMLAGSTYMLGIAYCLREGSHIRVDFIYERLSPRRRAIVDLIGYVVLLLPGLLWLNVGLFDYAYAAYRYGEVTGESAWNPVVWPFRTVWVVGFAVFTLQVLAEVIKALFVLTGTTGEEAESR